MRPGLAMNDRRDSGVGHAKPAAYVTAAYSLECEHANLSHRSGVQLRIVVCHAFCTLANASKYIEGMLDVLRVWYVFQIAQAVVALVAVLVVYSMSSFRRSDECFHHKTVYALPSPSTCIVIDADTYVPAFVYPGFEATPLSRNSISTVGCATNSSVRRDLVPREAWYSPPLLHVVTSTYSIQCVFPLVKRLYLALNCEHRRLGA